MIFETFYRLAVSLYSFSIRIAALVNEKAKKFIEGRKLPWHIKSKTNGEKRIWFHCASMGEFEQARPVIEGLREQFSDSALSIVVTFFSPSGYEFRKNYPLADLICYLPLDTPGNARKFIDKIQPDIAVFVKYEFWYHFLKELKKQQINTYSVSAIFRNEQVFFRSYGKPYFNILKFFRTIYTQDKESVDLLKSHGLNNVQEAGDTRYDRVLSLSSVKHNLPGIIDFCGEEMVFVAGSTWKEDMEVLHPLIEKYKDKLKFIIAPHEISEKEITSLVRAFNGSVVCLSEYDTADMARVLIVDQMGLLSKIYQYGQFAYIGGAFGDGLHNILEASCYGMPVFFGNRNYKKFREANELIELGGAFAIGGFEELDEQFTRFMDSTHRKDISEKVASFVKEKAGATEIILKHLITEIKF